MNFILIIYSITFKKYRNIIYKQIQKYNLIIFYVDSLEDQ